MSTILRGDGISEFGGIVNLAENVFEVDFGTVSNDNRYVMDFPIDGTDARDWEVRAEVFAGGVWSGSGLYSLAGADGGTFAYSNEEGIVVQTLRIYIKRASNWSGGGHGDTLDLTSAPCRVIAKYIGAVNV